MVMAVVMPGVSPGLGDLSVSTQINNNVKNDSADSTVAIL